jgi:general secretion pathway protein C
VNPKRKNKKGESVMELKLEAARAQFDRVGGYLMPMLRSRSFAIAVSVFAGWMAGPAVWLVADGARAVQTSQPLRPAAPVSVSKMPQSDLAIFAVRNPFAPLADRRQLAELAPVTALSLKLKGLRVAGTEGEGVAVIAAEGAAAKAFSVGDLIQPGVRLVSVHADRAILDREGRLEALAFERPKRALTPVITPVDAAASGSPLPPSAITTRPLIAPSIVSTMSFEPVSRDGRLAAYKVVVPVNQAISSKLRNNDMIVALDGAPAADFEPADLADRLVGYAPISLKLIRDSAVLEVRLTSES